MNRGLTLLVALSLLLAGCSFGDSNQTPTGPRGIGDSSVNETALVFGHLSSLENTSYRLTLNRTGRQNDSYRQWIPETTLPFQASFRKPSATTQDYYTSPDAVGMPGVDGVMHYTRSSADNGTYVVQRIPGGLTVPPGDRQLSSFVIPLEFTPAGNQTVDGTRYRVLNATGTDAFTDQSSARGFPAGKANVTDLNATVLVDQRGVIRSFRANYEYPDETLTVRITVDRIGSTTVQKPDWLSEACEQTSLPDNC